MHDTKNWSGSGTEQEDERSNKSSGDESSFEGSQMNMNEDITH